VVAALCGVLLYRETLTAWQFGGMALVLGGIVALTKGGRGDRPGRPQNPSI
jgi:drug/metabolite transporter (DMT)-like permease